MNKTTGTIVTRSTKAKAKSSYLRSFPGYGYRVGSISLMLLNTWSSKWILLSLFCAPLDLLSIIKHLLSMLARLQLSSPGEQKAFTLCLPLLLILLQQMNKRPLTWYNLNQISFSASSTRASFPAKHSFPVDSTKEILSWYHETINHATTPRKFLLGFILESKAANPYISFLTCYLSFSPEQDNKG